MERQLRDRMADEGQIEDDRPRPLPEAEFIYRDFFRLLQSTGMGAVNLNWTDVAAWAQEHGEPLEIAREIMYSLLGAYREISGELMETK